MDQEGTGDRTGATYRELHDTNRGRYVVAGRRLAAGDEVMRDAPVVVAPLASRALVCLGCHGHITAPVRCGGCGWPMCSLGCCSAPRHALECALLATDKHRVGAPSNPDMAEHYNIILALRCLLLQRSCPQQWRQVRAMVSHARQRRDAQDPDHVAVVHYVSHVLDTCFSLADIEHVQGAVVSNSFECRSGSGVRLCGLYPGVARVNHACVPNMAVLIDDHHAMSVRTTMDVEAGQELNISYLGPSVPLWERREHTLDTYVFTCQCARCRDPSELGLHYSSPRCPSCPGGYLLPSTRPQDTTWTCSGCGVSRDEADVRQQAEEWTARLLGPDLFPTDSPSSVGAVLAKVEATFHGRHFVWEKVAQAALKAIRADTTLAGVSLRRELWRRLLQLYDVLEPGLTRRRGVAMYEIGEATATLGLEEPSPRPHLEAALTLLEGAVTILQLEPEEAYTRRWFRKADGARRRVVDHLQMGHFTHNK